MPSAPTILVVDDDASIRDLLAFLLTDAGYRVHTAATAKAAIAIAAAVPAIDLHVCDVNIPGARGRELAAALGALQPHARVLYISGFGEQVLADEGIVVSAPTFLQKPFTARQLLHVVAERVAPLACAM